MKKILGFVLICVLSVGCGSAVMETSAVKGRDIDITTHALNEQQICAVEVGQVKRCKSVAEFREWMKQP